MWTHFVFARLFPFFFFFFFSSLPHSVDLKAIIIVCIESTGRMALFHSCPIFCAKFSIPWKNCTTIVVVVSFIYFMHIFEEKIRCKNWFDQFTKTNKTVGSFDILTENRSSSIFFVHRLWPFLLLLLFEMAICSDTCWRWSHWLTVNSQPCIVSVSVRMLHICIY